MSALLSKKLLAAGAMLLLLAAASWLPVVASGGSGPLYPDLGRAALVPPATTALAPPGPMEAVRDFFLALSGALAASPAPAAEGAAPATEGAGTTPASPAASASAATPAPEGQGVPPPEASATARPGTPAQAGTVNGETGFAAAYSYLAPAWRDRLSFEGFTALWRPLRRLDLLAAIAAGHPAFDRRSVRVFAEARSLVPQGQGSAIMYSYGFFVATPTPKNGWRLTGGGLQPESFATFARGSGEASDAAALSLAAAQARARGAGLPATPGPVTLQPGAAPNVTVAKVRLGSNTYLVRLYRLVDGDWVILDSARA